jgi:hypothetical protein
MSVNRFVAILLIFGAASIAWGVLGGTIEYRTAELSESLAKEVDALWGPDGVSQEAPLVMEEGRSLSAAKGPLSSDVGVRFVHHHRYKGLLWFSTYTVYFRGTYRVQGVERSWSHKEGHASFIFPLPGRANTLENLKITLNGVEKQAGSSVVAKNAVAVSLPSDGGIHLVEVTYETRGRDRWTYQPNRPLHRFIMTAVTNFTEIDYPKGTVSPIKPAGRVKGGMKAVWKYDNIRMAQSMGIEMPRRVNAGPVAARMSFFAPVSLFFFFTVLFTVVVLRKIPLHPMHYLFISAGFFAFHILLAYLVDKISIHLAFWICAVVSVALVVSYMRLVAGMKFALATVGTAQLVYLVGFSYAFFWVGWTGLAIVIAAILTLFVLMQATGRVNWEEVFGSFDRGSGRFGSSALAPAGAVSSPPAGGSPSEWPPPPEDQPETRP